MSIWLARAAWEKQLLGARTVCWRRRPGALPGGYEYLAVEGHTAGCGAESQMGLAGRRQRLPRPYDRTRPLTRRVGGETGRKRPGVVKLDLGALDPVAIQHTDTSVPLGTLWLAISLSGGSAPPGSRCPRTLRDASNGPSVEGLHSCLSPISEGRCVYSASRCAVVTATIRAGRFLRPPRPPSFKGKYGEYVIKGGTGVESRTELGCGRPSWRLTSDRAIGDVRRTPDSFFL